MIVAGFGFSTRAGLDSLRDALKQACDATGVSPDALATADDKADKLQELATTLALPIIPVTAEALSQQKTITQSARAMQERATGSVAEASALAAAGPGARLLTPRLRAQDSLSTCALAQGATS